MPSSRTTLALTKGSWATISMLKARARRATSRPTRPNPTMPSVLPRSSVPCSDFFSHLPPRVVTSARTMCRARASIKANVCSATATALAPGVFITAIPSRVAASRSMLSTPTPARPMTFSFCACSSKPAFTSTAERTSSASASEICLGKSPLIWSAVMTVQPDSSLKRVTAAEDVFSASTIFMVLVIPWALVGAFYVVSS